MSYRLPPRRGRTRKWPLLCCIFYYNIFVCNEFVRVSASRLSIQPKVIIFIKTTLYDNCYYCSFAANRYRSLKTFRSLPKINCFATRSNRRAIRMTGNGGRGSASLQLFSDFRRVSSITSQSCVCVIFLFYTLFNIVGWEKKMKALCHTVACFIVSPSNRTK